MNMKLRFAILSIVALLLSNLARAGDLNQDLWAAVTEGDASRIRELLGKGATIEYRGDPGKRDALEVAAWKGNSQVVNILLESEKVRANLATSNALHDAVVKGHIEIVTALLKQGATVDVAHRALGDSPLMSAASFGRIAEAELLLQRGANINFRNRNNSTPLIAAVFNDRTDMASLLVQKGADISIKDNSGKTALDHALYGPFGRKSKIVGILRDAEAKNKQ
jgi:uncharacterized protein